MKRLLGLALILLFLYLPQSPPSDLSPVQPEEPIHALPESIQALAEALETQSSSRSLGYVPYSYQRSIEIPYELGEEYVRGELNGSYAYLVAGEEGLLLVSSSGVQLLAQGEVLLGEGPAAVVDNKLFRLNGSLNVLELPEERNLKPPIMVSGKPLLMGNNEETGEVVVYYDGIVRTGLSGEFVPLKAMDLGDVVLLVAFTPERLSIRSLYKNDTKMTYVSLLLFPELEDVVKADVHMKLTEDGLIVYGHGLFENATGYYRYSFIIYRPEPISGALVFRKSFGGERVFLALEDLGPMFESAYHSGLVLLSYKIPYIGTHSRIYKIENDTMTEVLDSNNFIYNLGDFFYEIYYNGTHLIVDEYNASLSVVNTRSMRIRTLIDFSFTKGDRIYVLVENFSTLLLSIDHTGLHLLKNFGHVLGVMKYVASYGDLMIIKDYGYIHIFDCSSAKLYDVYVENYPYDLIDFPSFLGSFMKPEGSYGDRLMFKYGNLIFAYDGDFVDVLRLKEHRSVFFLGGYVLDVYEGTGYLSFTSVVLGARKAYVTTPVEISGIYYDPSGKLVNIVLYVYAKGNTSLRLVLDDELLISERLNYSFIAERLFVEINFTEPVTHNITISLLSDFNGTLTYASYYASIASLEDTEPPEVYVLEHYKVDKHVHLLMKYLDHTRPSGVNVFINGQEASFESDISYFYYGPYSSVTPDTYEGLVNVTIHLPPEQGLLDVLVIVMDSMNNSFEFSFEAAYYAGDEPKIVGKEFMRVNEGSLYTVSRPYKIDSVYRYVNGTYISLGPTFIFSPSSPGVYVISALIISGDQSVSVSKLVYVDEAYLNASLLDKAYTGYTTRIWVEAYTYFDPTPLVSLEDIDFSTDYFEAPHTFNVTFKTPGDHTLRIQLITKDGLSYTGYFSVIVDKGDFELPRAELVEVELNNSGHTYAYLNLTDDTGIKRYDIYSDYLEGYEAIDQGEGYVFIKVLLSSDKTVDAELSVYLEDLRGRNATYSFSLKIVYDLSPPVVELVSTETYNGLRRGTFHIRDESLIANLSVSSSIGHLSYAFSEGLLKVDVSYGESVRVTLIVHVEDVRDNAKNYHFRVFIFVDDQPPEASMIVLKEPIYGDSALVLLNVTDESSVSAELKVFINDEEKGFNVVSEERTENGLVMIVEIPIDQKGMLKIRLHVVDERGHSNDFEWTLRVISKTSYRIPIGLLSLAVAIIAAILILKRRTRFFQKPHRPSRRFSITLFTSFAISSTSLSRYS